jgi:hypothetical protein
MGLDYTLKWLYIYVRMYIYVHVQSLHSILVSEHLSYNDIITGI